MNNNEVAVNTSIEDMYGDNPSITQLPPILDTKSVIKTPTRETEISSRAALFAPTAKESI